MPQFRYKAINAKGKKEIGMMSADSIAVAKKELFRQKILVTNISHHKKKSADVTFSQPFILNVTRDLYVLLRANLPLYDSLIILFRTYKRR